jgi:hypothetical protein
MKIHKIIILHVVLYWCETWMLRISGQMREDVAGGWRKLYNEEHQILLE